MVHAWRCTCWSIADLKCKTVSVNGPFDVFEVDSTAPDFRVQKQIKQKQKQLI